MSIEKLPSREIQILLNIAKQKYPKGTVALSTLGHNNCKVISTGRFRYSNVYNSHIIWFIDKYDDNFRWAYENKIGKKIKWGKIITPTIDNYNMY